MTLVKINLKKIKASSFNPRKRFNNESLEELANSIKSVGLIQPISVRKVGSGYEVVCGESRYRAAIMAKLSEIDCIEKVLNDDEAFELAITENLQRQDVHPLDEAEALSSLKERGMSYEDIAIKLGKSHVWARQRVSLLSLTDELKDVFFASKIKLGQALKLSSLAESAQKKVFENSYKNWKEESFTSNSVNNFNGIVSQAILALSSAPWALDKADIVPNKPACVDCPFNSSCASSLFPANSNDSRCLDPECFDLKLNATMVAVIEENMGKSYFLKQQYISEFWVNKALEMGVLTSSVLVKYDDFSVVSAPVMPEKPEKPLLKKYLEDLKEGEYESEEEARGQYAEDLEGYQSELEDYQNELKEYDNDVLEYNERLKSNSLLTGVWLNGSELGKTCFIDVKVKTKNAVVPELADESMSLILELNKLKEREKRAKELDVAKKQEALIEAMNSSDFSTLGNPRVLSDDEMKAVMYLLFDQCGYSFNDDLLKSLGVQRYDKTAAEKIVEVYSPENFALLARRAIMNKFTGSCDLEKGNGQFISSLLMKSYLSEEVLLDIDSKQEERITKRVNRYNEKVGEFDKKLNLLKKKE